jgi:hypothetical protein
LAVNSVGYTELHYQDIIDFRKRTEMTNGLLKNCEFDTLAIGMIYKKIKKI